jgi:hypothetical protein
MIRKSKWIVAAVFLLSTLLMELALAAGSMRCGTHIITAGGRHGPGKYEVLKKCGEPTVRSGNTWIYEQHGGGRRIVVFDASGTNVSRID